MPFIFHSKRQTFFDKKTVELTQQQKQKVLLIQNKKSKDPTCFKIDVEICRQHPFRKLKQNISELQISQKKQNKNIANSKNILQFITQHNKDKIKTHEIKKNIINNQMQNKLKQLQDQIIKVFPQTNLCEQQKKDSQLIKQQKKQIERQKQKRQLKSTNKQTNKQNSSPGPGSYDIKQSSRPKATIFYSQKQTIPLCPRKKIHQLIGQMSRRQQQNEIEFTCSYKNQTSCVFKTKTLNSPSMKKNGELLSKLFMKKDKDKQEISDMETACQSRHVQRAKMINDDELEINQERSPSPCSYNPSKDFKKPQNRKNFFISCANRLDTSNSNSNIKRNISPSHSLQTQIIKQNQIKNAIPSSNTKQQLTSPKYPFTSTVPRQLHFDTQKLCNNEFYYSPKNNFIDIIEQKTNLNSHKLRFGSSLQRFQFIKTEQNDPYKYCQAKNKYLNKNTKNIASLKYTQNRQVFNSSNSNKDACPIVYNPKHNTILQKTQQILLKNQIKQKFKDNRIIINEKKKALEEPLQQISHKIKTVKNVDKCYENINPDKYRQYLFDIKKFEKQNIAFGQDKNSVMKRGIQPKKQVIDLCYNTQPTWKIGSFNKYYGHDVFLE